MFFFFTDAANCPFSGPAVKGIDSSQSLLGIDPLAFPDAVVVSATINWKSADYEKALNSVTFTFPISSGSHSFNSISCPLSEAQQPGGGIINAPIINLSSTSVPAYGYTRIRTGRGQYGYYHPGYADVYYTSATQADEVIATGGSQGPALQPGSTEIRVTVIDSKYTLSYKVGKVYFCWTADYRDAAGNLSTLTAPVTLKRRWNVVLLPQLKLTVNYIVERLISGAWTVISANPATSKTTIDAGSLYARTLTDDDPANISPYGSGYALRSGDQWSAEYTNDVILDPSADTVTVSAS